MFKSKRISLITIFAMLVSSMSFVGLSATAANAAVPPEFQSIKVNNLDVDIVNGVGSVTVAKDVTSVNLQVLSAPFREVRDRRRASA